MLPSLITLPLLLFVSLELTLLCEAKFSTSAQESKLVSFIQSKLTVHSPHESMVNDSVFPVLDLYQVVSVDENSEQLTVKFVLSFGIRMNTMESRRWFLTRALFGLQKLSTRA